MKLQYYHDSGRCRNTYFETKRSGGNDEQNKLRIKRVYVGYKFYDSSRLLEFIPWAEVPVFLLNLFKKISGFSD